MFSERIIILGMFLEFAGVYLKVAEKCSCSYCPVLYVFVLFVDARCLGPPRSAGAAVLRSRARVGGRAGRRVPRGQSDEACKREGRQKAL